MGRRHSDGFWFLAGSAAILLSGCATPVPAGSSLSEGPHSIAAPFEAYWTANGGLATFGPPLEEARLEAAHLRQTFLNAELVLDPSLLESDRIYLSPLGMQLGLAEPPVPASVGTGNRYFESTGHSVYAGFSQAYGRIGGETLAGPPIGEVQFRDGWVIQHYRNMGLIRPESSAPSDVRFLAYGLASRPDLSAQAPAASSILPPGLRPRPFAAMIDRLGSESVIGPPLTNPFLAGDGSLEQVYERAVLYSPVEAPAQVRLRPLGSALGPADPAVIDASADFGLYAPQSGHNIAWAFAGFYSSRGGADILGLPLEEAQMTGDVLRQRYENLVLEYHFELPPLLAVQLAPLGREYFRRLPSQVAQEAGGADPTPPSPEIPVPESAYLVRAQVSLSVLPLGELQQFTVWIAGPDGAPIAGLTPLLAIHTARADLFPALPVTDPLGVSSAEIALNDVQPGEIVNFEIFVAGESGVGYAFGQFAVRVGADAP